ncbi:MAG: corrinoid protein [Deltaproteobacteria bacterium]|nr:MAG: corrinoid protein [Deltaproteobacteria bacterium]
MNKDDLIKTICDNVIQGRRTKDDEGIDDSLSGTPGVVELVGEALAAEVSVQSILKEGLSRGMDIVGKKFEANEYFIPDMLAAAEAVSAAMDVLEPHIMKAGLEPKGQFVIATVLGDHHDIGKNIVAVLLKGAGFQVIDLGTDVPADRIIEAANKNNAQQVGLSALLTTTMPEMKTTIEAFKKAGLREKVKVLIGGAPTSKEFAKEIGADAHCKDAFEAIAVAESHAGSR